MSHKLKLAMLNARNLIQELQARTTKTQRLIGFATFAIGILWGFQPDFLNRLAKPAVCWFKETKEKELLASFTPLGATAHTHARTVLINEYIEKMKVDTTQTAKYARLRMDLTNAFDSIVGIYMERDHSLSKLQAYEYAAKQLKVDLGEGFAIYPWKEIEKLQAPVTTGVNRKKNSKLSGTQGGNDWGMEGREALAKDYIEKYHKIAIAEMEKFGIPASVALAQGLVESGAGSSRLAKQANNHFGMKCFSKRCRKGHCINATDDSHKDFFRKYNSAWESWRAHSQLLAGGNYSRLKKYGKDYQQWAYGLKALGYATDRTYAEKLIGTIEKYDLDRFDK